VVDFGFLVDVWAVWIGVYLRFWVPILGEMRGFIVVNCGHSVVVTRSLCHGGSLRLGRLLKSLFTE
jgi:hypothetical protein